MSSAAENATEQTRFVTTVVKDEEGRKITRTMRRSNRQPPPSAHHAALIGRRTTMDYCPMLWCRVLMGVAILFLMTISTSGTDAHLHNRHLK